MYRIDKIHSPRVFFGTIITVVAIGIWFIGGAPFPSWTSAFEGILPCAFLCKNYIYDTDNEGAKNTDNDNIIYLDELGNDSNSEDLINLDTPSSNGDISIGDVEIE
jgi:hypothetical protein